MNGGGNKEHRAISNAIVFYRKVLADENKEYQLLCANCNWIKRHENKEIAREYNLSPEGRERIISARSAWTPSEETREKMRQSHLGQSPSQETRDKKSELAKTSWTDPEIRAKRLAGMAKAKVANA